MPYAVSFYVQTEMNNNFTGCFVWVFENRVLRA